MNRGFFPLGVFLLEVEDNIDTFTERGGELVMVLCKATEPLAELLTVRKGEERDIDGGRIFFI